MSYEDCPDRHDRQVGAPPLLDISGSARDCGQALGEAWAGTLRCWADDTVERKRPWWRTEPVADLFAQHAPYLLDLYDAMAGGAGLRPEQLPEPNPDRPLIDEDATPAGCTSFALQPQATLDGTPISGQNKDTPSNRIDRYQVLRLRVSDGREHLTLTYPGWLFGHGFIAGGCAAFRNSLYAGVADGALPFEAWGLLLLHAESVQQAIDTTREFGVRWKGAHVVVADPHGGVAGLEVGRADIGVLAPGADGIYVHANAALAPTIAAAEETEPLYLANSPARRDRLLELLRANSNRLTVPLVQSALTDHHGAPVGLCRHLGPDSQTTATVIAEPAHCRLHVTRGAPCRNRPTTFTL